MHDVSMARGGWIILLAGPLGVPAAQDDLASGADLRAKSEFTFPVTRTIERLRQCGC